MCRSRRIGILQRALQPERAPHGSDVTARHGHSLAPPALHDQLELAPPASLHCAGARKVDEESPVDTQELPSRELHFELVDATHGGLKTSFVGDQPDVVAVGLREMDL